MATAPLNIPIKIVGKKELNALIISLNNAATAEERLARAQLVRAAAMTRYQAANKAASDAAEKLRIAQRSSVKDSTKEQEIYNKANKEYQKSVKEWTKIEDDLRKVEGKKVKTKEELINQEMRLAKAGVLTNNQTRQTGGLIAKETSERKKSLYVREREEAISKLHGKAVDEEIAKKKKFANVTQKGIAQAQEKNNVIAQETDKTKKNIAVKDVAIKHNISYQRLCRFRRKKLL